MNKTRVGIIGVGVIGQVHLKALLAMKETFEVVGVTDAFENSRASCAQQYQVPAFATPAELIQRGKPDYVVICTPHFSHTEIAIEAMRMGAHVFVEKPMSIHAAKSRECLQVARETGRRIALGYVARLKPLHMKMKELMREGVIGEMIRMTMVRTIWFRTMAYYRSGTWRGTWAGEGGGIIVNQAPHDLDLIIWLLGLPEKVLADMETAWHQIEVEDVTTAILKWKNGAVGTLHVNTAEVPGREYLEIVGTRASLLLDETGLKVTRLAEDSHRHSDTTSDKMKPPALADTITYQLPDYAQRFQEVHVNFAKVIRGGSAPIATGEEGVAEVELANALLVSGITQRWTALPVDPRLFDEVLARLNATKSIAEARKMYA